MSNGAGSTTMRQSSVSYGRRSIGTRRRRTVVYLPADLREYAEHYCAANKQSVSSLVEDLIRWLRDEGPKEEA